MCAIPNHMTNIFQLLHLSANRSCKSFLCREAQFWYSLQIEKQMKEDKKLMKLMLIQGQALWNHCMQNGPFHSMILQKIIVTLLWLDGENLKLKFLIVNRAEKVIPCCKWNKKGYIIFGRKHYWMIIALLLMILSPLFAWKFQISASVQKSDLDETELHEN